MIRRVSALTFAAGMHVFPGGVVDPSDYPAGVEPAAVDAALLNAAVLDAALLNAALLNAAVRETFEETGVLLAGSEAQPDAELLEAELLEAERLALIAHETSLVDVLARHRLSMRRDALRPWAHWITPDFEPRRYDTRFFVAVAPRGQDPRHVGGEADAAGWVRPADALAAQRAGEWLLLPPTETTLRELSPFTTADDAFAAAARRDVRPLCVSIDLDADPPVFVFGSQATP